MVGEFGKPGIYKITSSTRLSEIYERGLNPQAFPSGAILTRVSVKEREKLALKRAELELAGILASAVTSGIIKQSPSDVFSIIGLLNNLGSTDAIGRVIAEMDPRKIDINSSQNFVLEVRDTIFMPKIPNTVTIVGEVLSPITAPYNPRYSKTDYIKLAGGFKESANASKSYILLPNGKSLPGGNGYQDL